MGAGQDFALDKDKPLVWTYADNPRYGAMLGVPTWADSVVVLKATIEALAEENVHIVMTMGHHPIPDELYPFPNNLRCEPFLPGIALAKRSDLIIHHGGHGSCMTNIYAGTPAVIIPTYSERESNARRLAALGVAEYVLPTVEESEEKVVSVENLKSKVRQVLSDDSYVRNAEILSQKIQRYDGIRNAAGIIENFILRRPSTN